VLTTERSPEPRKFSVDCGTHQRIVLKRLAHWTRTEVSALGRVSLDMVTIFTPDEKVNVLDETRSTSQEHVRWLWNLTAAMNVLHPVEWSAASLTVLDSYTTEVYTRLGHRTICRQNTLAVSHFCGLVSLGTGQFEDWTIRGEIITENLSENSD